jgi:SGNH domain (fused to AT3 domains)
MWLPAFDAIGKRLRLPAFDAIGKRLHWKVVLLAKSSCPAPYTDFYNWGAHSAYPACDRWHSYAIARINHTNPDLVVMSGEDFLPRNGQKKPVTRAVWAAALLKTLRMITAPKTTKVILGPTSQLGKLPSPTMSPVESLAAHEEDVQACSSRRETMLPYLYADTNRAVAKQAGVRYIDVFPWFCSSVCPAVIANMVVYGLRNHLTATYATYLSGALQAALQPAMSGKRF